jgi:hypothetical protein
MPLSPPSPTLQEIAPRKSTQRNTHQTAIGMPIARDIIEEEEEEEEEEKEEKEEKSTDHNFAPRLSP